MSARKIDLSHLNQTNPAKTPLSLTASAVKILKSGVEFASATPVPPWTEMSVDLQYPDSKKVHCMGVVVACSGNRHSGYLVSLLFTRLSRQSLARLDSLTLPRPA